MSYFKAGSLIESTLSIPSASGTTTLTLQSPTNIQFTGSSGQTAKLPDATTLPIGRRFYLSNRMSIAMDVQYDDATVATTLFANTEKTLLLENNGTTNGAWDISVGGSGVNSVSASGDSPLFGDVVLAAGSNVTLTQTGQTISIAATGDSGSSPRSFVRVDTANGRGSINTNVRRFTNVTTNIGTGITYADSATLGGSFTINEDGIYSISYKQGFSTAGNPTLYMGITLNATTFTGTVTNLAADQQLATFSDDVGANGVSSSTVAWSGVLSSGDIIRAQDATGIDPDQANRCAFTIVKVNN